MIVPTDSSDYKRYHEEFMQNLNGTSASEIFLVILPAPLSVFLSTFVFALCTSLICDKTSNLRNFSNQVQFIIEFLLLIAPLVLCFTLASDFHLFVTLLLSIGVFLSIIYCYVNGGISLYGTYFRKLLRITIIETKIPYITNFRALTNVMTAICILAVDFNVFPRRFAKTETFGYGLMDTGVGLFVISNALVAPQAQSNATKIQSFSSSMWKSIKSCTPLIFLGAARFFVTKQADYQVHVSEYGVHWNFFITLAVTKILCTLFLNILGTFHSFFLPVIVIAMHQLVLIYGLQDWVLSNVARDGFLTANREGVASSLGYVALYFAGICLSKELKGYKSTFQDNLISVVKLAIVSSLLWSVTSLCKHSVGVSRRLANMGYFTWILALSCSMIVILQSIELLTRAMNLTVEDDSKHKKPSKQLNMDVNYVPLILDAINFNGLLFFLLANIMTGLVNISVHTLSLGNQLSVMIIYCYCFVLCSIIVFLYVKRIKLKIW